MFFIDNFTTIIVLPNRVFHFCLESQAKNAYLKIPFYDYLIRNPHLSSLLMYKLNLT